MQELFRKSLCCRIVGVLALAGWGCSDERTELFIQGNVAREPPNCEARAEDTAPLIGVGVLDVGLKFDYQASLLVGSQLAPRSAKQNLRSESMIAIVHGAEVHVYSDTGSQEAAFTVPASGVILPNTAEDAGYGIINATLIPQTEGSELANEIGPGEERTRVAEVSVFGKTAGGLDVESAAIRYVIKVCRGCLVDFPLEALTPMGECSLTSAQGIPDRPCDPGQDSLLDCRYCARNFAQCVVPGG